MNSLPWSCASPQTQRQTVSPLFVPITTTSAPELPEKWFSSAPPPPSHMLQGLSWYSAHGSFQWVFIIQIKQISGLRIPQGFGLGKSYSVISHSCSSSTETRGYLLFLVFNAFFLFPPHCLPFPCCCSLPLPELPSHLASSSSCWAWAWHIPK